MISAAQQRGRLRSLILRSLKQMDVKGVLKNKIKANNQSVTGNLLRSISRDSRPIVNVRSSTDESSGLIQNVRIFVELPWGKYGEKIDSDFGRAFLAEGQMIPPLDRLKSWVSRKGVGMGVTIDVSVKNEETGKVYNYTYSAESGTGRNMLAWRIQQDIIKKNRLKTKYEYSGFMQKRISDVLSAAVAAWIEEIGASILADVETIIVKEL